MYQDFFNRNDDYLNEFKQKIANQKIVTLEERRSELARSRNNFFGTLAGITLAGVVGWFVLAPQYTEANKEIPVIRRPQIAVKSRPEDPKGMYIPNRDKDVYDIVEKKDVNNTVIENLLPEPEKPKLPDIIPEVSDVEENTPNSEVAVNETGEKVVENAEETASVAENKAIPDKPTDLLTQEVKQKAKAVRTEVENKVAEVNNEVKEEAKAVVNEVKAQKAAAEVNNVVVGGNWQIQLIASKNKDAVEKAWVNMSGKFTDLKKLNHEVQETDLGSQGMFYRLRAGAFVSKEEAQKFCAMLKTKGLNDCIAKEK